MERGIQEGLQLSSVTVGEDCAITSKDKSAGRRGLVGVIVIMKVTNSKGFIQTTHINRAINVNVHSTHINRAINDNVHTTHVNRAINENVHTTHVNRAINDNVHTTHVNRAINDNVHGNWKP